MIQYEPKQHQFNFTRIIRVLVLLYGVVFLAAALLQGRFINQLVFHYWHHGMLRWEWTPLQSLYLIASVILIYGAWRLPRLPALHHRLSHPAWVNGLVALLVTVGALLLVELTLRQTDSFQEQLDSPETFVEDATLGWRMKKNAAGRYGKVHVTINAHGLRGPARCSTVPNGRPP